MACSPELKDIIPELKKLKFDDFFEKYYGKLPIVNSEEALKFIES